ncbi:hypothetical protein DL93DRAFT_1583047 [Clavulina sp. PMI_390]|nr:hypothetical protein DL93DRAFT_1583047 [Clavulina sp. PMI_390]
MFRIVRPGGPDMLKTVRQNEKDATALQQESFKLFSIIATTLAGQDRSKWREIMDDVDSVTTEFPQDVRKDLHEAGKIMTASNWAAEVYQSRVGLSKWWNAEQDADQMAQAFKCLQEISATLKVRSLPRSHICPAPSNEYFCHDRSAATSPSSCSLPKPTATRSTTSACKRRR